MNKNISQQLGEALAHFQDLTDTIAHTIVKRVNKSEGGNKLFKSTMEFISTIGDSYYKKYSAIKRDSSERVKQEKDKTRPKAKR